MNTREAYRSACRTARKFGAGKTQAHGQEIKYGLMHCYPLSVACAVARTYYPTQRADDTLYYLFALCQAVNRAESLYRQVQRTQGASETLVSNAYTYWRSTADWNQVESARLGGYLSTDELIMVVRRLGNVRTS